MAFTLLQAFWMVLESGVGGVDTSDSKTVPSTIYRGMRRYTLKHIKMPPSFSRHPTSSGCSSHKLERRATLRYAVKPPLTAAALAGSLASRLQALAQLLSDVQVARITAMRSAASTTFRGCF